MEKQLPITLLIVGLVVGMGIGYIVAPKSAETPGTVSSGGDGADARRIAELEQDIAEANARIETARDQFPTDIYAVTGDIMAIDGDAITLGTLRQPNPLLNIPKTMTVTISGSTQTTRRVYKDSAAFAQELADFHERIGPQGLVPKGVDTPSPYVDIAFLVGDLEVGMEIEATATELIEGKDAFTAARIEIISDAS